MFIAVNADKLMTIDVDKLVNGSSCW
jgi:hypothetical protein